MTVYYDKGGVYIADGHLDFSGRVLRTKSSNKCGDTILADAGFHSVYVKRAGLLSPSFQVVMRFYYPQDKPDEIVWTTQSEQDAHAIASAIQEVLG